MKIPFTNLVISRSEVEQPKARFTNKGTAHLSGLLETHGVRIAPQNLWQVYRMNADVYSCIREIKQGVGDGGWKISSVRDEEVDPAPEDAEFTNAFFRNSGGVKSILSHMVVDIGICGNAYFEIVKSVSGKPFRLSRLDPRTMFIVADKYGQVLRYFQRVEGGGSIEFQVDEIFHVVNDRDPDNALLGFPALETALMEARTDISASQSNYHFFENDAVPSVLYIAEQGTSEDEQKSAVEAIKEQFGGARNRNKAGMLSGVKEVKVLSMSQKDMEFVVGRKFNTDKVCSVYGVPKYILGYTETVNYSAGAKLFEKFYRGTVQPWENNLQEQINQQLFLKIGIALKVQFKFLPQSFNEAEATTRLALDEMRSGAITLRQYKVKTGQKVTPEDEAEPLIDRHILHQGASAVLLSDVGVEPVVDLNDEESAQNMVRILTEKFDEFKETKS